MSQYTDFYSSWLGNGNAFGGQAVRLRDQEPLIFKPTDISGCRIWLDANDSGSVNTNEFNTVLSWENKGTLGGQFDLSGSADIVYGDVKVNGLNTISFTESAFMQGRFQLNFQARSVFFVAKQNTVDLSNANPWFTSDTNGGMETFGLYGSSTIYFIGKHPSPVPELAFDASNNYIGTPVLTEFINGSDLSNNWLGLNGTKYPALYEAVASGYNTNTITYFLGAYFGGTTLPSSQDFCEIIIYEGAINPFDREQVETYLKTKWNLQEPTPPPTPPFSPTDISGLQLWLDANNTGSVTINGSSEVLSWSNLGSISTSWVNDSNYATYTQDANSNYVVSIPTATNLSNYAILPYYSRSQFVVFECVDDLTTLTYPYVNLLNAQATDGFQSGVSYDSNTATYYTTVCQSGTNCPIVGTIPSVNVGGYNLAIYVVDSNSSASTLTYWNGGSNRNTSTDLGNLFNQNPVPYFIGSTTNDSPDFRMGELIEYDSVLSSSNISTVADYLVNKWAISSFTTLS